MCWSLGASIAFTTIGLVTSIYFAIKKWNKFLVIPLFYFTLMEILQAFSYLYIDNCSNSTNQVLTLLSYIHFALQPFFINMINMYFIPDHVRKKIQNYVYTICLVGAVAYFVKAYPFEWAGLCKEGVEIMCGSKLCTTHGQWHLAWFLPLNGLNIWFVGYAVTSFYIPLIYGSWRFTLYNALTGPILAMLLIESPNEWPALWCLFSVGLMLLIFFKPLQEAMIVKKWYFWKYPVKK